MTCYTSVGLERNQIGYYLDNNTNENFSNEIKESSVLATINPIGKVTHERDKLYSEICKIKHHDNIGHLKQNFTDNENRLTHDSNESQLKSYVNHKKKLNTNAIEMEYNEIDCDETNGMEHGIYIDYKTELGYGTNNSEITPLIDKMNRLDDEVNIFGIIAKQHIYSWNSLRNIIMLMMFIFMEGEYCNVDI